MLNFAHFSIVMIVKSVDGDPGIQTYTVLK